ATRTDVLTRPPCKGEVVGGRRGPVRCTTPLATARVTTPARGARRGRLGSACCRGRGLRTGGRIGRWLRSGVLHLGGCAPARSPTHPTPLPSSSLPERPPPS